MTPLQGQCIISADFIFQHLNERMNAETDVQIRDFHDPEMISQVVKFISEPSDRVTEVSQAVTNY